MAAIATVVIAVAAITATDQFDRGANAEQLGLAISPNRAASLQLSSRLDVRHWTILLVHLVAPFKQKRKPHFNLLMQTTADFRQICNTIMSFHGHTPEP